MQITSTNSLSAATAAEASPAAQTSATAANSNFNAFLQLLVTEMRNQDPTKPMDPTQTVSQLASFSAVEQAVQTNAKLDSLLTSSVLSQAGSLIGKTISLQGTAISGKVVSVTTSNSGLTATLDDGVVVPLTPGITVS